MGTSGTSMNVHSWVIALCTEDVFVEKVERAAEASPGSELCCKCSKKNNSRKQLDFSG